MLIKERSKNMGIERREEEENLGIHVILIWPENLPSNGLGAVWFGWLRIPNTIMLSSPSFLNLKIRQGGWGS